MGAVSLEERLQEGHRRYEERCKRCGRCCGALDGDPCAHLLRDARGRYICGTYRDRFGKKKTVSGKTFRCVSIRDLLKFESPYPGCGYFR
ncbi:MAG: hypothetical protein MJA29_10245 [Candidatus Omnitrophica bacterium]|nr:hypothetical protein [Candidatus Omnitrophota bacterium]